jgi:hypothetical protein
MGDLDLDLDLWLILLGNLRVNKYKSSERLFHIMLVLGRKVKIRRVPGGVCESYTQVMDQSASG